MERVQKILSNWGYCSRRKAEKLIEEGKVKVNGKTISLGDKAEETDKITVDGEKVSRPNKIYIKFHKPLGCVTALEDPHKKTIMDYIKIKDRIFPVGRLDYNTSGLLLLTNDGDWANKIAHPRYEVKKTYIAELETDISNKDVTQLRRGVKLRDGLTKPALVEKLSPTKLEIKIHEGRNRIIRRMLKVLGYSVKSLKRVQIGDIKLGRLKVGEWEYIHSK